MWDFPRRYEALKLLGRGGGGEVWSVRCRITGETRALKLLAPGAGEGEVLALIREATTLSGLDGLGLPLVLAFGRLGGDRRYFVRELVRGQNLDERLADADASGFVAAVADAADRLTVVHRAGVLHGDVKPANLIVRPEGGATWIDLGLAAPWRDGGSKPQGLTPHFAAPELMRGEPLTVRAEVYSIGRTLDECLKRRGEALGKSERAALADVVSRATETEPSRRFPSVDEVATAIRHAAKLPAREPFPASYAWPVTGAEQVASELSRRVRALERGHVLLMTGPVGSGRTTLARRLAWTLGVDGIPTASIGTERAVLDPDESLELELEGVGDEAMSEAVIIVDDAGALSASTQAALERARKAGARLVLVVTGEARPVMPKAKREVFDVPALDSESAEALIRRALPSLPSSLTGVIADRAERRPGTLRRMMRRLEGHAIVSPHDVDEALGHTDPTKLKRPSFGPESGIDGAERAMLRGRIDEAERIVAAFDDGGNPNERLRATILTARIQLARGAAKDALSMLENAPTKGASSAVRRTWMAVTARAHLRSGAYREALRIAEIVTDEQADDATFVDALCVRGVALAFTGDDAAAQAALRHAVQAARAQGDDRMLGVAYGSLAIAHQRAGRNTDARSAYEKSLEHALVAEDATSVALTRLNLAALAREAGELQAALTHLEAAVDMGRRAGSALAVQGALLTLANLDLYLGRLSRAKASIASLERSGPLPAHTAAQLLGLSAELAGREGEMDLALERYEKCACAWEVQGRAGDAAEARLEALLLASRSSAADVGRLRLELGRVTTAVGEGGLGEHRALASLVAGSLAIMAHDEQKAWEALDDAVRHAREAGRPEWEWMALEARSRLATSVGHSASARRDIDAALAILEDSAARLPGDLREVFWNDPRRRRLREANVSTHTFDAPPTRQGSTSGAVTALAQDESKLARILEITRELAREHELARVLDRVTEHAIALVGAERGLVLLLGESGALEARKPSSGPAGAITQPDPSFSKSVAERVMESAEPVIAASALDDERLKSASSVHQLNIQSIACVPIRGAPPAARPIGALYLETRLKRAARFSSELPILLAFADQAAIAIENARLLTENAKHLGELERANKELERARDKLAERVDRRTEQLVETRRNLRKVRAELGTRFGYGGLVGTSDAMRRVYAIIDRIKDTNVPVLILGESGTGKEVVARAIHQTSQRAKRPFLGVNCGAIPDNLLESELFGHVRGAFTGADRDRKGLFREASGGTLLLDEIGEMPLKMQSSLLRVLQESAVRAVGSSREEPVDTRVIAATNRPLEAMVAEKRFREDLFYRLQVVEVRVPPLRERADDIVPLIDHFLSMFKTRYDRPKRSVSRGALRRLRAYTWPGNVRQLEHTLLNAWLMSDHDELQEDDFDLPMPTMRPPPADAPRPAARATRSRDKNREDERERIATALDACGGNRVQAAKMLGVPRRTFYRRLKEHGLL